MKWNENGWRGVCKSLKNGGQGRNRTADASLFRAALYRLSYLATNMDSTCRVPLLSIRGTVWHTFGARRLILEFDLPLSHPTLERIWRAHGLITKRRRKYQKKQDLSVVKATWRLFQQISADTKALCDVPHYWPQAQAHRLPLVQYTEREVRIGLLFLAFAQRRSATSAVFVDRIQQHLRRCGVSLRHLAWQTVNGSEFVGGHDDLGRLTGFPAALGTSQHLRIPPAAHTYQSDVEGVHRLIEDEFFDLESFASRSDFLSKATTYQLYFNRKISPTTGNPLDSKSFFR
jgi:hypothetical protein